MALAKLIKRPLINIHHLNLFYWQSKLPLVIQQNFQFPSLNPSHEIILLSKTVFNFLRRHMDKIQNTYVPFTNTPLEETIKICCNSLYKNQESLSNISKNQLEKLLRAALSNNCFLFDGIVYQQVEGVAMSSLLGPSLTNTFLSHYEQFGSMIVQMSISLCIVKDMWTIYLLYFDLPTP